MTAAAPAPKDAVADAPRRKGLGKKQLAWLRKNMPAFADMEARALASKEPKK